MATAIVRARTGAVVELEAMAAPADGWLRLTGVVRFCGWPDGTVKAESSHRRRRAFRIEILILSTRMHRYASRTAGFLQTLPMALPPKMDPIRRWCTFDPLLEARQGRHVSSSLRVNLQDLAIAR